MTVKMQSFFGNPKFQSFGGGKFEARGGGVTVVFSCNMINFNDDDKDIYDVGWVDVGKTSKIGVNNGFNTPCEAIIEYKGKLYVVGNFTKKQDNIDPEFGRIAVYDPATGAWSPVGPNQIDFDKNAVFPSLLAVLNGDLIIGGNLNYSGLDKVDDTTRAYGLIGWDGTDYFPIGGGALVVNGMGVYNNELYFSNSQGFP